MNSQESITWSWKNSIVHGENRNVECESITWSWKLASLIWAQTLSLNLNPLHGVESTLTSVMTVWRYFSGNPLHGVERCHGTSYQDKHNNLRNPLHGVESLTLSGNSSNLTPNPLHGVEISYRAKLGDEPSPWIHYMELKGWGGLHPAWRS